ncbi:hypothetical protein AgCh_025796 [Apium graveolens]
MAGLGGNYLFGIYSKEIKASLGYDQSTLNLIGFFKDLGANVGIFSGLIAEIYLALYGNDPRSLIFLIAWLPATVSVAFVYTIRTISAGRQANEKLVTFPPVAYDASATIVCVLLFFPLFIIFREELFLWNQKKIPASDVRIEIPPQSTIRSEELSRTSCFSEICSKPPRGEDYTILQALFGVDMPILPISTACGIGSNLTAVDNLGQIGESLGYPMKTVNSFVSLVSIWNYFGRIFAGLISEKLLVKYKFPRPLMTTIFLFLSCVGHLLIAFPVPRSVYVASVIIGFSFGAQFPLLTAIISEIFGLKHYRILFNVGQLASPVGSYLT